MATSTAVTRTGLPAALLLATVIAAACWSCADASHSADLQSPLLDQLRRVARSPQLPNPMEMAEKARDMAKTARDMAHQHISERVSDLKDKMEEARGAAASIQSQGVQLPSTLTSMASASA